jgi:hypothetical protein
MGRESVWADGIYGTWGVDGGQCARGLLTSRSTGTRLRAHRPLRAGSADRSTGRRRGGLGIKGLRGISKFEIRNWKIEEGDPTSSRIRGTTKGARKGRV